MLMLAVAPLGAQQSLESSFRTTGSAVTAAFEAQRLILQRSSAVIFDGRREINYGIVISSDGHIITKASEVDGIEDISVTVDRTNYKDVKILAQDPTWDVALIQVNANNLTPIEFAANSQLNRGTWVVANGVTSRTRRRALAGVISANSRPIPADGGVALGVVLQIKNEQLQVEELAKGGAAEKAGIQKGDIILAVDQKEVKSTSEIAELLSKHQAGDSVEIRYLRDSKTLTCQVKLGVKSELFGEESMDRNDQMSGDFSRRRSGFPRVLQHDILGASRVTGGPLLNLQNQCVGMNIARANRAESFAIPVEELREIIDKLKDAAQKP